jgi:hypothetical protein
MDIADSVPRFLPPLLPLNPIHFRLSMVIHGSSMDCMRLTFCFVYFICFILTIPTLEVSYAILVRSSDLSKFLAPRLSDLALTISIFHQINESWSFDLNVSQVLGNVCAHEK